MNPMLKRRLHLATFFVLIPLALVVTIFWVLTWLFRLVTPLTSLVTVVVNGVRSWTLTNSDSHHHMTSMTLAPHQPTTNTATTTLHHWSSTECGIGMILLITLLVCVSIIASRSLGKIPIDVTHLYTWKRSQSLNKTDDSATVCSPSPALPNSKKSKSETTSPPLQPLELSTGIILPSHDVQSPMPTSIVEMSTSSPVISTRTDDLSDGTQMESTQPTIAEESTATTMTATTSPNTNTIDKRRKKRNKHLKKKDRGKRMSAAEQQSNEQQQQQQQQATRTKPGDSTTTQKMSVKTSQQSTILVPPSPPPPCDDRESSTLPLDSTPPTVPPSTSVTQKHFSVKSAPTLSTNNRSPPSPSVSPNDRHHPSITPTKEQSTISGSPASIPTLHQPMVTKLISNKKDSHPPISSSSTKAFTSFPSTPSPPSSSTTTTAPTTSSITGRQSWYSPFNTGLEFDLLSRSPPSPTHTYVSTSSSSSPSLSTSSTTFNQNDYRLFTDPPSSRPPPPPPLPSIGGYNSHLQQQQQLQQQTQQIHQLHQYPSHSHSHHHATLPLQHYQRHPQIQQHHHFQQPSQLNPIVGGNTYDQLFYGTLPTPTPPSSSTEKTTGVHMESSSSIADLPPPPMNARLPTPPVSLSPVITPPNMPPPSSSSSFAATGEPSSSSTFPFSLWYPWKSRSGVGGQSPTLHHHQQPQQQESIYQGIVGAKDEHGSPSFSLFDRKLSFQSGGSSRSHGASQH